LPRVHRNASVDRADAGQEGELGRANGLHREQNARESKRREDAQPSTTLSVHAVTSRAFHHEGTKSTEARNARN
jgi:hypothetical protein